MRDETWNLLVRDTAKKRIEKAEAEMERIRPEVERVRREAAEREVVQHSVTRDPLRAIEAAAEEVRKADRSLTREQAVDRVYLERPELVRAYRDAPPAPTPERVERAAPRAPGSNQIEALEDMATKYAQEHHVSADKAYTEVLKSDAGRVLTFGYYAASGVR